MSEKTTVVDSKEQTNVRKEDKDKTRSDDTRVSMDNKTKVIPFGPKPSESATHVAADNQPTVRIDDFDVDPMADTVMDGDELDAKMSDSNSQEKTSVMFGLSDIQERLDNELANIPDDYESDLDKNQMSELIQTYFPGRTDEDRMRINRHFLNDAEPLMLERLSEEIKKSPEGLKTGFKSLDARLSILPDGVTLIAAPPRHGKTNFMLNLLVNMCRLYPEKRFIYYTYRELKWETAVRIINLCGSKQFSNREPTQSNLERWKREFKHTELAELKEKADKDPEYEGLKRFMEISSHINLVDSKYDSSDLVDSIHSFGTAFKLGAVFVDSLPSVLPGKNVTTRQRSTQMEEIINHLTIVSHETRIPIILGVPITGDPDIPEYDNLSLEKLREVGNPGQKANLIIGLQDYSRSRFIGSDRNPNFKSTFYGEALKQAQPMPESIKDMMQKTVMLVKVIVNKSGPEPETELIFHKQLLNISDQ